MLCRTIMVATRLDIFEALAAGPLTSAEVAQRCGTHPLATEKLLIALVGLECLRIKGDRYALRQSLRARILKDGKYSFRDQILLHFLEWNWWEHCEEFVRTGEPLSVHHTMTEEEWGIYQGGMRSGIQMPADWIARHLPLPRTARAMLDIGGSHGYFSVATNRELMQRIAQALRPGGFVAIWEPLRQNRAGKVQQFGGLLDLFFRFFSKACTWSAAEVTDWFRGAGLETRKSLSPSMMPGLALHVSRKPLAGPK